jgi:integrase
MTNEDNHNQSLVDKLISAPLRLPWADVLGDAMKALDRAIQGRTYRGLYEVLDYDWLDRVGLRRHSPHKFRHGHATYTLKRCDDIADRKAVSQKLTHSSLQVTDSIYSVLSTEDVGQRIARSGREKDQVEGSESQWVSEIAEETLRQLKHSDGGDVVT